MLWEKPPEETGLDAREIRERMMAGDLWEDMVPPETRRLMNLWDSPERLRRMRHPGSWDNEWEMEDLLLRHGY